MILNDAYAGHRKWWHKDQKGDPALVGVWTEWDYILLRAYQYIEDFTTPNGHLSWIEEDTDVWWDISRVSSTYSKDIHDYRENNDVKDWESLRAKPMWNDDVEPPSMEKWLRRMEEEETEPNFPQGGTPRPPTAEELAALTRPTETSPEGI